MFHCRKHVSVAKVHSTMGPQIFHQAFHITLDSFWCLYSILLPHICTAARRMTRRDYQDKGGREGGNYVLPPIPNGLISPSIHLGAALHQFAGGSPYDIVCHFGIGYTEVLSSVWIFVEAINECPQFNIAYPDSLEEERKIEAGFEVASTPGIPNCAGAIDGILIWMLKPSLKEVTHTSIDQKKYLCGQKYKLGLNCQAITDCQGRILDISIKCGGVSSDCLAFEVSDLYTWLENGLMHQDRDNNRFVCLVILHI